MARSSSKSAKAAKPTPKKGGGAGSGSEYIGRRVSKKFAGELYHGTVSKYVAKHKLWAIKYDDGDAEEMDWDELSPALELFDDKDGKKKKRGRPAKKSNVKVAATEPMTVHDVSPEEEISHLK